MANINFLRGTQSNYDSISVKNADSVYFITDTGRMFLGDTEICEIGVCAWANLPTAEPTKKIYYISDKNILAYWNGAEWVQINPDTGATSVQLTGNGNLITSATYDAETRTLTLVKGATAITSEQDVSNKADKVSGATNGHLAALDASGNLTDSGKSASSFDIAGAAASVLGSSSDSDTSNTVYGVKKYVDSINSKVSIINGSASTNGSIQKALSDAKSYADGLAKNYDAAGSANSALTNSKAYTDTKVAALNTAIGNINQFEYEVISSLPTPSQSTMFKIYLIEDTHSSADIYDEYITLKSSTGVYSWEKIGNTDIDLSQYAKKTEIPTALKSPYTLTAGSKKYDGSSAVVITAADLGALTSETQLSGGGMASTGEYISSVTVSGHNISIGKNILPVKGVTASGDSAISASASTKSGAVSVSVSHANIAGTAKSSYSAVTLTPGTAGNIVVPVYDAKGHVTGVSNQSVTVKAMEWETF